MTKNQISDLSANQLVPAITDNGYFLTSSIDGSTETLSWTNISIPVVDTCFNRFSTNACDSAALYDKISQVSSDTYQEVLTQLQYTGGGLGAAAYLSANLGDFTNNAGFIEDLASYSVSGGIALGSTSSTITLKTNSLSRLTIKNDGTIGIGTTLPVTPLTINSVGELTGNFHSHLAIIDKTAYNQALNGGSILFGGLKSAMENDYWSKNFR